jgi:hypothetical protein
MKNFFQRRLDTLNVEWPPEFQIQAAEATGVDGDEIYVIKVLDESGKIMFRETYLLNGRESPGNTPS